jgi:hypothetical protein
MKDNKHIKRFNEHQENLNIVCQLEPGDNEFTLTVITVMKKEDFKAYRGQFVLEV